ncbi:MAG: PIN domain-containing protein, partial [Candidatus Sulfotelmatobacter sp.]
MAWGFYNSPFLKYVPKVRHTHLPMDVALDANIILNDPRMHGNAFHNLLAYLRKTDSRLILSKIIFDEAIARYPERLRSALHKATGPVGSLRSLLFDTKIKLPDIDVPRETKKFKQQLLKPSQYVRKSLIVKNYAKISLEEVIKRGVERIPPANGAGEELRDVMHWLMILAHAQNSSREIAFISEDEHFRKDNDLHPRLGQDIQENNAHLHFYISIDEFIKAKAPAPRDLAESEVFGLYPR